MERETDLDAWIDLAVKDRRKVMVLVDHLELYRKTPAEYEAWRAKGRFQAFYPPGPAGHKALMADFERAAQQRRDALLYKGWEIYEGELDTGAEAEPMRRVDMIGWHISPAHGRAAPNGQTLLKRARQVKEIQKQFPVPMVLFHPFTMRLENLQRAAKKPLTVPDYRFFQPGEQEELAALLKGSPIYIEISHSTARYLDDPACREALIADIKPLAELGVEFTVSTDAHGLASAKPPFEPARYCEVLGVTPANTNAIVRELAKRRR